MAAALLLAATAGPGRAGEPPAELSPAHLEWLATVELLITPEEREAFLGLPREHQRQAFIRRFWEERDPFPETALNEFEETWAARLQLALERFGGPATDRGRAVMLAGPPDEIDLSSCPALLERMELWSYRGSVGVPGPFSLVFVRGVGSPDGYRLWSPGEGLSSLVAWNRPGPTFDGDILNEIRRGCPRGRQTAEALGAAVDWFRLEQGLHLPRPSPEWVASFLARSTEVPEAASRFAADLEVAYPARRGQRTVVQGLVVVPRDELPPPPDGAPYQFLVDGEVLRGERGFDQFRYRFALPADATMERLPLVIQRLLRPGHYTLVLRVREVASDRFFRAEQEIDVPARPLAAAPPQPAPERAALPPVPAPPPDLSAPSRPEPAPVLATGADPFAEANAVGAREPDYRLRILPPPEQLLIGKVRIEAVASAKAIRKVAFHLNGQPVLTKTQPPFSVELDLGPAPRLHTVEAVAYGAGGRELARDEVSLNRGPHRFAVRLVEPEPRRRYRESLRIEAEVRLPEGETLDRVELFVDDDLVASLYQAPFVQPVLLTRGEEPTYVRARAVLVDGNAAEDLVLVNAPDNMDRLQVDFVELYTSVVDRGGRPVEGLQRPDFTVLEDGVEQSVRRFERVRDLPIHAGVMIDCSTSMAEEIREAERAALRFFERVLEPKDRAAVILFNDVPELKVPFTNSLEVLAGGLVGVVAEGETAIYDSLVFGLYYFAGIQGKRALILLSDGQDSNSRHSFDDALEFAQRSGTAVYTIGLGLDGRDTKARNLLSRLARETGGQSFLIQRAAGLDKVYDKIEEELRTQYLLGYQSTQQEASGFRQVEVRVAQAGLKAKTISGYYP